MEDIEFGNYLYNLRKQNNFTQKNLNIYNQTPADASAGVFVMHRATHWKTSPSVTGGSRASRVDKSSLLDSIDLYAVI